MSLTSKEANELSKLSRIKDSELIEMTEEEIDEWKNRIRELSDKV